MALWQKARSRCRSSSEPHAPFFFCAKPIAPPHRPSVVLIATVHLPWPGMLQRNRTEWPSSRIGFQPAFSISATIVSILAQRRSCFRWLRRFCSLVFICLHLMSGEHHCSLSCPVICLLGTFRNVFRRILSIDDMHNGTAALSRELWQLPVYSWLGVKMDVSKSRRLATGFAKPRRRGTSTASLPSAIIAAWQKGTGHLIRSVRRSGGSPRTPRQGVWNRTLSAISR